MLVAAQQTLPHRPDLLSFSVCCARVAQFELSGFGATVNAIPGHCDFGVLIQHPM